MDLRGISFEWIAAMPILAGLAAGCATPGNGQTSAINRDREKDALDRADKALDKPDSSTPVLTARSQAPMPPSVPETVKPAAASDTSTEMEVRVVARVGNAPIYDREVKEAVTQRLPEFFDLRGEPRRAKEKAVYYEELKKLIERELIIDELMAKVKKSGNDKTKLEIEKIAAEEAEKKLKEYRKKNKIDTDEEFLNRLKQAGLTKEGVQRQLERESMKDLYMHELVRPKLQTVSLAEIHDYYDRHTSEYTIEDSVKWNDLFISAARYANRADAKRDAESRLADVKSGKDFGELVKVYDHGDSKFRNGQGAGEKRGQIRPPECEEALFGMKSGEAKIVEIENGFHIVKVVERIQAGIQPFNEKVQNEIKKKLQRECLEREYRRLVDEFWRRAQPQYLIEQ